MLVACAGQPAATGLTTADPPATTPASTASRPSTPTAAAVVPPELLGVNWTVIPTRQRRVALTFDCGGNADGVASILRTLSRKGVKQATFFMTGHWARMFPEQAAQLGDSGYLIGNHTENHEHLTHLSDAEVRAEIRQGRRTVRAATEVEPKPWLRFPYGEYDDRILGITAASRWVAIGWTVDTLGWKGTKGGQSVDTVVQRVLDGLRRGEIVLMHVGSNPDDGSTLDADALPRIIHDLREAGYRFFTPAVML